MAARIGWAKNIEKRGGPRLAWWRDLREEPDQDIVGLNSVVLGDGVTLRTDNKANATVLAFEEGVGLNMAMAAGTNRLYNGGSGTAPAVWLDLDGDGLPAALREYGRTLTVWVKLGALSLPVALNQFVFGLKQGLTPAGAANGNTHQGSGSGWYNDAGTVKGGIQRTSTLAAVFRTVLWTPTLYKVGAVLFDGGPCGTFEAYHGLAADFPGRFPDDVSNENLEPSARDTSTANTIAGYDHYRGTNNRAFWALCTGATTGAPSCTIEAIGIGIGAKR
jgi:hypothetical protein